jgi:hypothetical protein
MGYNQYKERRDKSYHSCRIHPEFGDYWRNTETRILNTNRRVQGFVDSYDIA